MEKSANEIHYREFDNNNDLEIQRQLFELSFPEAIGTPANTHRHYHWKFREFPEAIPSYEYVADETKTSKELVGYYAAIPFIYKIGSRYLTCGMVCDVMTHPERRGKGIFTKIGKFATDDLKAKGLSFTTGYPIRPEVIPGHIKVGWKVIQQMPMYLRPIGIGSFLPASLKFLSRVLNPPMRWLQFWTQLSSSDYKVDILNPEAFLKLNDFEAFLEKWLSEQQNALVKSKDFLKWRTGAPEAIYYFLTLRHKGELVGFSLVRPTTLKGIETLAILDISILQDHLNGARSLHQALMKLALTLKKDVVVCMLSKLWAKKYKFLGSFYIPTPSVFSLIVKKLDDKMMDEEVYTSSAWHVFWVDSDDL